MQKSLIHIKLILLLLLAASVSSGSYAPSTKANSTTPTLYINPPSITVNATETFHINATISNIIDLAGWEFKLYYHNNILNGITVAEGPFLKQCGSTAFFVVDFNNHYNATHGRIWLTCTLLGNVSGASGSGTLATISFLAEGGGNTTINLAETVLGDSQANSISHTTNDGEVRVIGLSDIAITNVHPLKTIVGQGYNMHINITIDNQGDLTETFNFTAYANVTAIETREVTLESGTSTILTIFWNTTGFVKGNYIISAYAAPVLGETDTSDNNFTDGWIVVTIIGDVNGDFKVDLKDVYTVAVAYGSYPGDPRWNPNLDMNNDNLIDLKDYYVIVLNYGKIDS
jgi:hypothetical protein